MHVLEMQKQRSKTAQKRLDALMPGGIPRYVHCYDSNTDGDRYTVVFTGHYKGRNDCDYVGMNAIPFNPCYGIGMHGWSQDRIDANRWGFAPPVGKKNHLGTRIKFEDLPEDCQKLVLSDYKEIWNLA